MVICPKCGSNATGYLRKNFSEMYEVQKEEGIIKRIPRKKLAKMKEFHCARCGHEFNEPKRKKKE